MTQLKEHITSIDIMRGLTLFLMLFVNDLYVPGVPKWLVHTAAQEDGMGLADWVFPGFLFMVGLSIPFAFKARRGKGESDAALARHILTRSLSLLIIGVFMVNVGRYDQESAMLPKNLWAILVYVSVFLIWNRYPKVPEKKNFYTGLRLFGVTGLLFLAIVFQSDDPGHPNMNTSWWGILGLIGWGYLAAAFCYLLSRGKWLPMMLVVGLFLLLNVLGSANLVVFPPFLSGALGVILKGSVPFLVSSGVLTGMALDRRKSDSSFLLYLVLAGILSLGLGFLFRNWFIISKILATPSWGLICTGISLLVFSLIFFFFEKKPDRLVLKPFVLAGQNSLTTYLAPDIIYYILWTLPFHVLFYKQDQSALFAVIGSLGWSLLMVFMVKALTRIPIKLKL